MSRAPFPLRILVKSLLLATGEGVVILASLLALITVRFEGSADLPADCAMVFGAAVRGEGEAGPGIRRRVGTAINLYTEGNVQTIFLSGGKGSEEQRSEARVMRTYAINNGVPGDRLIVEDQSTSTWENLQNTRPLTEGCQEVVAISDRYHLARIELLAWLQGWENLSTYPADWAATQGFEFKNMVREAAGIILYLVKYPGGNVES